MFRATSLAELGLDAVFNASPNAYVLFDRDLVIVGCNDAYLKAVGRDSRAEIVGRKLFDAFPSPPESQSRRLLEGSLQRVLASAQPDHIALIPYDTARPGEPPVMRYWSATHTPIFDTSGVFQFILQHTVDVTDLQRLREASARSLIDEAGVLKRARDVQAAYEQGAAERARLTAMFEQAPGFVGVLTGPEHVFQIANEAYGRLVGNRRLVGLSVAEALPEVVEQGFVNLLNEVRRSGVPFVGRGAPVRLLRAEDGGEEERFVDFVYQPLKDENGAVYGIFVQGHDITDQKLAEAALAEKGELLRLAQEGAGFGTFDVDLAAGTVVGSPTYGALFGIEADKPTPVERAAANVHADDRHKLAVGVSGADVDSVTAPVEYRVVLPDGVRWVWRRGVVVRDKDGAPIRVLGAVQDITQRKEAEERLQTVARESAHRVKNTLAIAQGIVSVTLRNAKDLSTARATVSARLAALAATQPALIEGEIVARDIAQIVADVMALHRDVFGRVRIEGPSVHLEARTAQGLGLILHELATNAVKYGALSNDVGLVDISWTHRPKQALVAFTWRESGGPSVVAPSKKGFGTTLIERSLPSDPRSAAALAFDATGVVCHLTLPAQ